MESVVSTVTRLTALDFSTHGNALLQERKTLTLGDLKKEERLILSGHRKAHVRLFAPDELLPTDEPFLLHMTRALSDAFNVIQSSPEDAFRSTRAYLYLIVGQEAPELLQSDSLAESMEGWLRHARRGEVLIDLTWSNRGHLEGMWHDYFIEHVRPKAHPKLSVRKKVAQPRPPEDPPRIRQITAVPDVALAPAQDRSSDLVKLEQDAAAWRAELASDWLTAAEVSRRLGSKAENASQLATKLRRTGKLLAVYLPVPGGSWRFPTWQFQANGQPVARWHEVLRILHEHGSFLDTQRRTTGWGEVEWFLAGHTLLKGLTPAEVLATDPAKVLAAAEAEFGEDA